MEKVKVNPDVCIGCGACAAIAPDVFIINDDGLAESIEGKNIFDTMNEDLKNDVMDALEGCPTGAIFKEAVKDEDNKKSE